MYFAAGPPAVVYLRMYPRDVWYDVKPTFDGPKSVNHTQRTRIAVFH